MVACQEKKKRKKKKKRRESKDSVASEATTSLISATECCGIEPNCHHDAGAACMRRKVLNRVPAMLSK